MILMASCLTMAGCADDVRLPSREQLTEFHNTGPAGPAVDLGRVTKARLETGPYLVKPEEVLELTMPAVLQIVTAEASSPSEEQAPYICRVSEAGTINLPAVGEIEVAGRSTAQIEAAVAAAYFPRFTTTRPSIYARILEHRMHRVSIVGAVKEPGLYDLRADKMSLVALLMEAKGITQDGAAVIRISHSDKAISVEPAAFRTTTSSTPIRFQFAWTGPLCTAGTLSVYRGDALLVRNWLDIGAPMQRRDCFDTVRSELDASDAADLEAELSRFALWLSSPSGLSQGVSRTPPGGWRTTDGIHFDAVIAQPSVRMAAGSEYAAMPSRVITPAMLSETPPSPREDSQVVLLPVRGLNIPFADVALREGDTVVVEPLVVSFVSVLGLVSRPGNFEYPPGVEYNLGQVIALAGGLDRVTDPRYATIYRLEPDGNIVHAVFQIQGGRHKSELTDAFSTPVKPGDVVAVEQTPRTRSNQFIDRVLRFNIGTYVSADDLWN